MTILLRDGKDPWTCRMYRNGEIIEGEFTDLAAGETMGQEVKRLISEQEDEP